jgi:tetratricopeptide (TPR) repeat protein
VRAGDGGYLRQLVRLSLQKLPFVVLGLASLLITAYGQAHAGAIQEASGLLLTQRLANASSSYLCYVGQWLFPVGSSIFHPLRTVPAGLGLGSALALLAITQLFHRLRARAPALLAGWLWFLATLLPVIGLVQIGGQARADRFTYVPSLGLGMLLIWGVPAALRVLPAVPQLVAAVAVLLPLGAWARVEIGHYADSEQIWRHALASDPDNFMAHNNLGVELERQGRASESEDHYREAVRLHPSYPPARSNLGNALARRGDYAEALPHFELALRRQPQLTEAQYNLGLTLAHLGRYEEAAEHYREALRLTPGYAVAHYSLGALLVGLAHEPEGLGHLRRAVALEPSWAEPRAMLARLGAAP